MKQEHVCLDVDVKEDDLQGWYQTAALGDVLTIDIPWYRPGFVRLHRSTRDRVLWNACPGRGSTMAFGDALGRLHLLKGRRRYHDLV